ncbi:MAG TPA: hypothetical protein VHX15_14245 [Frankiaceae bacterium]|jgi:hypothetical protein|nr:hypothetical protein [Frankiaceae bacterium]
MESRPVEITIRTDADVRTLWMSLVPAEERRRRSLWMVFLDADDRTLPMAFPIDDLPATLDTQLRRSLGNILREVTSTSPARSAVLLLCRPGPDAVTAADLGWAAGLRGELGPTLCRWPLQLATPFGLHSLEAEGLSAAS